MDLNEGIRLLTGKPKISLPLKKKAEAPAPVAAVAVAAAAAPAPAPVPVPVFNGPVTTQCRVMEGGVTRNFRITIEPPAGFAVQAVSNPVASTAPAPAPAAPANGTPVFSPFEGKVELVEIGVRVGDAVAKGQVVAAVEAMKAKHDVKAPCAGKVISINAEVGSDVMAGRAIMTIGG